MGTLYKWNENPLRDFLFRIILLGDDITDKKIKEDIDDNINFLLSSMGVNERDLHYLDFELKKGYNDTVRVIPKNVISALWFISILPNNCNSVNKKNSIIFYGKQYKFNKKTKRLTWKSVKE